MIGAISPFLHMNSWREQGQLYLAISSSSSSRIHKKDIQTGVTCSTLAVMSSVTAAFLILYFVITVDIPMVQSTE
jgi:hypothetical protein